MIDEADINDEVDIPGEVENPEEGVLVPYECMIRVRAARHAAASETRHPSFPLYPDSKYLVGCEESRIIFYSYPDREHVYSHELDPDLVLHSYFWHPDGENLLFFAAADSFTAVHLYLLDVEGRKQKVGSFENAQWDTNRICLEGLAYRVGFHRVGPAGRSGGS